MAEHRTLQSQTEQRIVGNALVAVMTAYLCYFVVLKYLNVVSTVDQGINNPED